MSQFIVVLLRVVVFGVLGFCLLAGSFSIVFMAGCNGRACENRLAIALVVLMVLLLAELVGLCVASVVGVIID